MKIKLLLLSTTCIFILLACGQNTNKEADKTKINEVDTMPFEVDAERFGDLQVLRYQIKGFDELSLQQKQLAQSVIGLHHKKHIKLTITIF